MRNKLVTLRLFQIKKPCSFVNVACTVTCCLDYFEQLYATRALENRKRKKYFHFRNVLTNL